MMRGGRKNFFFCAPTFAAAQKKNIRTWKKSIITRFWSVPLFECVHIYFFILWLDGRIIFNFPSVIAHLSRSSTVFDDRMGFSFCLLSRDKNSNKLDALAPARNVYHFDKTNIQFFKSQQKKKKLYTHAAFFLRRGDDKILFFYLAEVRCLH